MDDHRFNLAKMREEITLDEKVIEQKRHYWVSQSDISAMVAKKRAERKKKGQDHA